MTKNGVENFTLVNYIIFVLERKDTLLNIIFKGTCFSGCSVWNVGATFFVHILAELCAQRAQGQISVARSEWLLEKPALINNVGYSKICWKHWNLLTRDQTNFCVSLQVLCDYCFFLKKLFYTYDNALPYMFLSLSIGRFQTYFTKSKTYYKDQFFLPVITCLLQLGLYLPKSLGPSRQLAYTTVQQQESLPYFIPLLCIIEHNRDIS